VSSGANLDASCLFVFIRALTGVDYDLSLSATESVGREIHWAEWSRLEWAQNAVPRVNKYVHSFLRREDSNSELKFSAQIEENQKDPDALPMPMISLHAGIDR